MLLSGSPPTDFALSPNFVDENMSVGTPVGQFSTTDPDQGDSFRYTLIDGFGDNDNSKFTIEGNQLKTNVALNYEEKGRQPTYSIVVQVADPDGGTLVKRLSVFVQNVNEPPELVFDTPWVAENQPSGTVVGSLTAVDPEGDSSFTYSLVSGIGGDDNAAFIVEGAKLKTTTKFDFETQSECSIRIRVADSSKAFRDYIKTVDIIDANDAPTGAKHKYTAHQNTDLAVAAPGLLEGANDPEGVRTMAILVPDSGPSHGSVNLQVDGSFLYQPDENYTGADAFQYKVSDGKIVSDPITVNITVGITSDAVVELPTVATHGSNAVLALVEENIRLVDFTTRNVLLDEPASSLESLTIVGAKDKPDKLTIDPRVRDILAGGLTFNGGSGHLGDTLVLQGSSGANQFVVQGNSATVNALNIQFSNVEQLILAGGVGNDTYQIDALPINTTITDSRGIDTLDFSGASRGVTLDLGRSSAQRIFGAGGTLALKGTIENAIGTAQDDTITGNSANNVLVGGAGHDRLDGGAGRDVLIGGAGSDTLRGGAGEDLLIAGATLYDDNSLALAAIQKQWASARSFAQRSASLAAGINDRAAGKVQLKKGASIFDDQSRDAVFGGSDRDWFCSPFTLDAVGDRDRTDRLG